jgi:hypothetical protein
MKAFQPLSALLLGAALISTPAFAIVHKSDPQDTPKQDIKAAGQDTKNAADKSADATKNGTQKAYHSTKRGTKKAYHSTKHGTKKAWNKTKSTTTGAVDGAKQGAKQPQ